MVVSSKTNNAHQVSHSSSGSSGNKSPIGKQHAKDTVSFSTAPERIKLPPLQSVSIAGPSSPSSSATTSRTTHSTATTSIHSSSIASHHSSMHGGASTAISVQSRGRSTTYDKQGQGSSRFPRGNLSVRIRGDVKVRANYNLDNMVV